MSVSDLSRVVEQYHRALDAFVQGDPEPCKRLWSRGDDVTLANPLGPPARGWPEVEATMDRADAQFREAEALRFEHISGVTTAELAYVVHIERNRVRAGHADALAPLSLRVTTIFRPEDGEWRIVHRHADPLAAPRPLESIVKP